MPNRRTSWKTLSIEDESYSNLVYLAKIENRKLSGQIKQLIDQEYARLGISRDMLKPRINSLS
jgi:predicted CopG family antitoxin